MMEVLNLKILILFIILISTLFLSSLPWKIVSRMSPSRSSKTHVLISLGNCFSGGVFLCVTFLHILPHVREDFGSLTHLLKDYELLKNYPLPELIFVCGFLLVLFVEQMVLNYKDPDNVDSPIGEYQRAARAPNDEETEMHLHSLESPNEETTSVLRSVVLLMALSLHSILEGLSIGLQNSERELYEILAAIISHKLIMAFTFGLSICQSKLRLRTFVIFVTIFAVSCPLGIAIGCGISQIPSSETGELVRAVLTGVSGGTFLFVTFFEIIAKEFEQICYARPLKFFCLFLGFLSMSSLLVLHSHN